METGDGTCFFFDVLANQSEEISKVIALSYENSSDNGSDVMNIVLEEYNNGKTIVI